MIDWSALQSMEKVLAQWVTTYDLMDADGMGGISVLPTPLDRALHKLLSDDPAQAADLMTAAIRPSGALRHAPPAELLGEALQLCLRGLARIRSDRISDAVNDLFRAELHLAALQHLPPSQSTALVLRLAAQAYSELQWTEPAVEAQRKAVSATGRRARDLLSLAGFHLQWAITLERFALTASSGKLALRAQLAAGRAVIAQVAEVLPAMPDGVARSDCLPTPVDHLPATQLLMSLLNSTHPTEAALDSLLTAARMPLLTIGAHTLLDARIAFVQRRLGDGSESLRSVEFAERRLGANRAPAWIIDELQFQAFSTRSGHTGDTDFGATYVASINRKVWNHEQDLVDDFRSRLEEQTQLMERERDGRGVR